MYNLSKQRYQGDAAESLVHSSLIKKFKFIPIFWWQNDATVLIFYEKNTGF